MLKKTFFGMGLLVFALASTVVPRASWAHPFRGSEKWSVILCKTSDAGNPPKALSYYQNMFFVGGTGGMDDFWKYTSYNGVNLDGSVAKGWYTMGYTLAQEQARTRGQRYQDCLDAAKNSHTDPYTPPSGQPTAVVTYPDIDLFGFPGGAYLPSSVDVGAMSHEVGHGFGLNHSFSDDPNYRNADWAAIGEYDDEWDLMSYAHVFATGTPSFGNGGPTLNGYHRDRMGWLPRNRILTFGADGSSSATVTLASLDSPGTAGALLVRIPFDPGDMFHYYTVEFKNKTSWDNGFAQGYVFIHEVNKRSDNQYYSYVLRERTGGRLPVQSLNANGVTVQVLSVSPVLNQATVRITSNMADRCLQGWVWREASPTDHVCVTPAVRSQTQYDNSQAPFRRDPHGGPYGPDTCLQGWVWRDAFANDHVCVSVQTRSQAAADNAQAANRRNPARFVYGPNTCKQGYVWREADASDWVCVTPQTRTATQYDNSQAPNRRNPHGGPYGPDTCLQGWVWRDAFPNDHVCVSVQTRSQAAADNAQASNRLMTP